MEEHIRFYCGLSHKYWSSHLCDPGPYACISPIVSYGSKRGFCTNGVYVGPDVRVLQDSGAYAEVNWFTRMTFVQALERQERHAEKYGYTDKIVARASYDLLIDHRFAQISGRSHRRIMRCTEAEGRVAVDVTVAAAQFLSAHRNGYNLALNVQGVTPDQYLQCVKLVVPLLQIGDVLGFGGWCVLGRLPSMMVDFLQVLAKVLPFLAHEGVSHIHLYGCIYTPAISACLAICDHYGITMSLDSAYPTFAPSMGKWGYGSWRMKDYVRPKMLSSCSDESCTVDMYCCGLQRIEHVRLTREWLSFFRDREVILYNKYKEHIDQYCDGLI